MRVAQFIRASTREVAGIFGVVLLLVALATIASILATAGLGLIAFIPLVGLAIVPLQAAAWLVRGFVFEYLGADRPGRVPDAVSVLPPQPRGRARARGRIGDSGTTPRMTAYDTFLSRAASEMQESAIRRMGKILAQNRDIISFAPGYPAVETFPWSDFQAIAHELLSGSDGSVLQYGPTRGYRPLLELIAGIMEHRGVASSLDRLLVTTGSQQALDLVARVLLDPGDVILVELPTYTGAITAFRNVQARMEGVPQEGDGIDLAALEAVHARLIKEGRRVRVLYVVPNFQNPTGLLIGLEQTATAPRVGRAQERPHRGRRSVPRAVLRGFRDGSGRPADEGGRFGGTRRLPQQLFEDAGSRIPRRLDRRAGADRGQARDCQAGRGPVHGRLRSAARLRGGAQRHPRSAASVAPRPLSGTARRHGGSAARTSSAARSPGRRRAAGSFCGRSCPTRSTPIA